MQARDRLLVCEPGKGLRELFRHSSFARHKVVKPPPDEAVYELSTLRLWDTRDLDKLT